MKNDLSLIKKTLMLSFMITMFGFLNAQQPSLEGLPAEMIRDEIVIRQLIGGAKSIDEAAQEIEKLAATSTKLSQLLQDENYKKPIMEALLKRFPGKLKGVEYDSSNLPSSKLALDALVHGGWDPKALSRRMNISPLVHIAVDANLPEVTTYELGRPLDREKAKKIIAYLMQKGVTLDNFEPQFAEYYQDRVGHARGDLDPEFGGLQHTRGFIAHEAVKLIFDAVNSGKTDLHVAAIRGDIEKVRELVKTKRELINKGDSVGNTPLHEAAWFGKTEIIRELLGAGADRNAKNKQGETPSDKANFNKQQAAVELLRTAAVQPRVQPPQRGAVRPQRTMQQRALQAQRAAARPPRRVVVRKRKP